jgi:hypothetical protein
VSYAFCVMRGAGAQDEHLLVCPELLGMRRA